MSQKRLPEDGKVGSEGNNPEEKRQRTPALRNVILEAVRMHAIQTFLSGLEPLIRRVVKEEVEMSLRKHLASMKQNCDNQIYPPMSEDFQLQFINKLSLPVFTGTRIEGEEGSAIKVALVNALTGQIFKSCPESLAKVEIVVLEGDFECDKEDDWTLEEFRNNIVREREGKRSLLVGNAFVNLNEGIGVVDDLAFTDNSSWTRSRKFRLGARVVDGNCGGLRVREAKTEPFMVKDHRGELYKKHYPPSLFDEVWRLEKIGKDGAFHKRLCRENINIVKDFLTLLYIDTPRLRNILGTGMSSKMWEVTVEHAKTCTLNNQMYMYYPPNAQPRIGVVFNVVGQVLGLLGDQQYVPNDNLPETEKDVAQKLVKVAYEHWEEVVSCDDGSILNGSMHLSAVSFPSSSTSPGMESSYSTKFPSSFSSGFTEPCPLSPDIASSILSIGGIENYTLQGIDNMDLGYDLPSGFMSQATNSLICDPESITQTLCSEDHMQYFDNETTLMSQNFISDSQADLCSAVSGFLAMSARSAAAAAICKANTRWTKLFSVLRLIFSIKRIVASKKCGVRLMECYG